MDNNGRGILGDPDATDEQILQAWEYAVLQAMEVHRRTGVPMAVWDGENQQVVLIPADELLCRVRYCGPPASDRTHQDGPQ